MTLFLTLCLIIAVLLIPTMVEVTRDRKGDSHPNADWKFRALLCACAGIIVSITFNKPTNYVTFISSSTVYAIASGLLFSSLFPYWINFVHLKNGVTRYLHKGIYVPYNWMLKKEVIKHVLQHLSDTAWPDKTEWWRKAGAGGRLVIYVILYLTALMLIGSQCSHLSLF